MKRFFAKHARSSALLFTLSIHGVLLILATGFVAFKVLVEPKVEFRPAPFEHTRPRAPARLKPPKSATDKRVPKPTVRPKPTRITSIKPVNIAMPQVAMIGVPMAGTRVADEGLSIGFDTTFDFFDSKAHGDKVCFIVHFGPATIGKTPYSRMTGYTIRKRLQDILYQLPDYTLFNVACYWASDTCAMSPTMLLANPANKEKVLDWMEPVNPLEGDYGHCFVWQDADTRIRSARESWPTRVEQLPAYSPKWVYPYTVPQEQEKKYMAGKKFTHWGRAVAWSILTQKPDTIFVLTTNYIDGWGGGNSGAPQKMVAGYKKMMLDTYGPDKKTWPTINVVVLSNAGRDASVAGQVLNGQFGPLLRAFKGDGSVIGDISKFMNSDEKKLLRKYSSDYGN